MITSDPENNKEYKEAEDVKHEEDAFCHGKGLCKPDVEGTRNDQEHHD